MLDKQIHEMHLSAATTKTASAAPNINYKAYAQQQKKGNLVTGRTHMFEQKVADLVSSTPKPLTKPKTFKHEIKVSKPVGTPVNATLNDTNAPERVEPKANAKPPLDFSEKSVGQRKYPPFQGIKLPAPPQAQLHAQEDEWKDEVGVLTGY